MIKSCAAIVIAAKHGELTKVKDASGIAYTVGTLRCKFEFRTTDWDYTTRTAVFCKGNVATNPKVVDTAIGVLLDGVDECAVPPEVLLPDEKYFSVGVWGVTNSGLRIVSAWLVFNIKNGCYVDSAESFQPTPSTYEQIMMAINAKSPIDHKHDEYVTDQDLENKHYVTETSLEDAIKDFVSNEKIPDSLSDLKEDETHRTVTDAEKQTWNNKVDKINGYSLMPNAEITRLANVVNYDDTQVKGDIAKKADATTMTTELNKKVDKVPGKSLSTNDFTDAYKEKLDNLNDIIGGSITNETDPTVPAWAKEPTKPTYTANEVGAEAIGAVSTHNTSVESHNDIRILIQNLTNRLNALADSDDVTLDQMSEVVAYIKNNATLIASITTNKVNVSDIVDNVTTNVANKPLSAAQGVALKALIDNLNTTKLDASSLAEVINTALAQAKLSGEFDGKDGYAPVRGIDYWTDADKEEMKAYIDESILGGKW